MRAAGGATCQGAVLAEEARGAPARAVPPVAEDAAPAKTAAPGAFARARNQGGVGIGPGTVPADSSPEGSPGLAFAGAVGAAPSRLLPLAGASAEVAALALLSQETAAGNPSGRAAACAGGVPGKVDGSSRGSWAGSIRVVSGGGSGGDAPAAGFGARSGAPAATATGTKGAAEGRNCRALAATDGPAGTGAVFCHAAVLAAGPAITRAADAAEEGGSPGGAATASADNGSEDESAFRRKADCGIWSGQKGGAAAGPASSTIPSNISGNCHALTAVCPAAGAASLADTFSPAPVAGSATGNGSGSAPDRAACGARTCTPG
jgi:hypothetical protein